MQMVLSKKYIAGFFDGEGSVTIMRNKRTKGTNNYRNYKYGLVVSICNTNKKIMEQINSQYPGVIYEHKDKRLNRKKVYVWQRWSKKAILFLNDIEPFVNVKLKQIQIGKKFQTILSDFDRTRSNDRQYVDNRAMIFDDMHTKMMKTNGRFKKETQTW